MTHDPSLKDVARRFLALADEMQHKADLLKANREEHARLIVADIGRQLADVGRDLKARHGDDA